MNILLVDDEIIAVNGLRAAVNWDKIGIKNVYYAFNVADAKEIINKHNINILICDIEMPMENGFKLLEWIQFMNYEIVSLLLTCHADFSYAKEGIKNGVTDYLLKPVDITVLEEAISSAKKQVTLHLDYIRQSNYEQLWNTNKVIIQERFWHDIVTGMYQNSDYSYIDHNAALRSINLSATSWYLPIIIFIVSNESSMTDEVLISDSLKNTIYEFILLNEKSIPVIKLATNEYLVLLQYHADSNDMFDERCKKLSEACQEALNITILTLPGRPVLFGQLVQQVAKLRHQVYQLIPSQYEHKPNNMTIVDKIKEIIHQNVNQVITRETIGKEIFLNPDYLSKKFKKETGQSLSDYITEIKIIEAKRLLMNTDKSIGIIAADLGYTNFSYFSKMFKEQTGMTPNKYRQINQI